MKQNFLLLIFIVIVVSSSSFSSTIVNGLNTDSSTSLKEETIKFTVTFPNLSNIKLFNKESSQRLELRGFGYLMIPGKPMLPVKSYLFALPPGAKVSSIVFKESSATQLQGVYNILPVEPILLLDSSNFNEQEKLIDEWKTNYHTTYLSNQAYPENAGQISGFGTLRKYSYVSVSICPFKYFPKSKQLFYFDSIEIIVNYKISNVDDVETMKKDVVADEKALNLFENYEDLKELYAPLGNSIRGGQNSYDYVIITNNELKNIISTSNFIHWKTCLGYNIKFVTITDSEITSQSGVDLAEQIRNFLREYYIPWGIKYVLIVGDYATIPMRYCSPNPNSLVSTVPTDAYYADLSYPDSESWNSNGDYYYGVYGQDLPDFMPEVYVGRIPTSNITRLAYALDKITSFGKDTGAWKNNALMGGAMLFYANEDHNEDIDFDVDGARLINFIGKDLMNSWTVKYYSEYEGLSPSIYNFDILNEEAFTSDWRSGQYSVVNWAAHGAPASIGRVIWDWDDGDGIPEHENNELTWGSFLNTYSSLEDDYSSIVFAVSCNVGRPEPTSDGNLGIDLLTKESFGSAVAICSATRGAAVSADWFVSHSGAEALCYEFNHYMINGPNGPSKLGEALYDSKSYVHYNFGWDHEYEFMNMYDYNLYGDPSMMREGANSSAPSAPQINGSTMGKTSNNYNYTLISIDPTDDNVFYYIEWGDGEIEEWIGPYSAGELITVNHSWSEDGYYSIRAKAKDDQGEESVWSDPLLVKMPYSDTKPVSLFFELFFQHFPNVTPLLQQILRYQES